MPTRNPFLLAQTAILTLAEIKAVAATFDRGETNAHDTLEAILEAVAAYQAAREPRREAARADGSGLPVPSCRYAGRVPKGDSPLRDGKIPAGDGPLRGQSPAG